MSVYKPKGSPYWHFDFVTQGRRYHGSTGVTAKAVARRIEQQKRNETLDPARPRKAEMTMAVAAATYLAENTFRNPRDRESKCRNLVHGLGSETLLSTIDEASIRAFITRRREHVGPATINRDVGCLQSIIRHVEKSACVPDIDWRALRQKEPHERRVTLRAEQERRLLDALPGYLRPLVTFAIRTGARLGTLTRLRWDDVDLDEQTVTLRDVKSQRTGGVHVLPLSQELVVLLANQAGQRHEYVFTYESTRTSERSPLTTQWRRHWKQALAEAGLEGFVFHDTRHVAATRYLAATGDLAATQELLGHADVRTTRRYAKTQPDIVRRGLERVSRNSPEEVGSEGAANTPGAQQISPGEKADDHDVELLPKQMRYQAAPRPDRPLLRAPTSGDQHGSSTLPRRTASVAG